MTSKKKRVLPILLGLFLLVFQTELLSQFIPLTSKAEEGHIKDVFPEADAFSAKDGDPPYYKAYKIAPPTNRKTVVGLVFFTVDASPRERGYEGPINIAVGINLQGLITQIKVVAHREPYGYFSIDRERFPEQFKGKSLRDRFRMGRDIDAVTRATMSIGSATRSIRKGARQIVKQYLEEQKKENSE